MDSFNEEFIERGGHKLELTRQADGSLGIVLHTSRYGQTKKSKRRKMKIMKQYYPESVKVY